MKRRLAVACALLLAHLRLAGADDIIYPHGSNPVAPSAPAASGGLGSASMAAAVLCAAAGGWLYWRNRKLAGGALGARGRLSVAETRSLGNRQYLVVAAYGEKKFLIGVCPGQLNLLAKLDEGSAESAQ